MQVTGFKITFLGAGGAAVLAVAGALLFGETSWLDATSARAAAFWATIPAALVFFLPLFLTFAAWVLERLGLLQRIYGTLYKDLTDSQISSGKHLSDKDKLRLQQTLERWKAPMPHLARADSVLALWGGKERWSLEGFARCWAVALIYPLAVLLLVWVIWNNGQLGAATIIPAEDDAWLRWLLPPILAAVIWLIWASLRLSNQPDRLRHWWVVRRFSLLRRQSDATLSAFAFALIRRRSWRASRGW